MPRSAPSFSPLQLFAPILLLVGLVLFFLSWIDIQIVPPPSEVKNMPKEQVEMMKKEFGLDPTKPIGVISQSGFQVANGTASLGSDMKRVMDKMDKVREKAGAPKSEKSPEAELNAELKKEAGVTAPLLFLFPVVLLAGVVLGCIPWAGIIRKVLVASCCAAAIGIIGLQAVIGFPLENKIKEEAKGSGKGGAFKLPGVGGAGARGGKSDPKDPDPFRVAWNAPLYLTILLLLSAAGAAFLGPGGAPAKSRRRRYGDDEDDEDEDDRPRKTRRRADDKDDEEDDRPRKRRRDDDDEPPRKKKPAPAAPASPFEVVDDAPPLPPPPGPKPAAPAAPARPAPPPPPPASDNPFAFDDDEPKPKKKPRPRDDDDEDDRPRKKRRRDDD
jgi:hypothetical protein